MADKKPITDGRWWHGQSSVHIKCYLCGRLHKQRPAVMRYVPEMDFGNHEARKHPLWPLKGWLLWGYCSKRRQQYLEVVGDVAVKRWDTQIKGWRDQYSKGTGGYLP